MIFDVSFGADICIWAHVRYFETHGYSSVITQPCPPIVSYCEIYRHELIGKLSPIHSPMGCTSVYMKKYRGIGDSIAALSPCISKKVEFEATKLAEYNITYDRLLKYIKDSSIKLPETETNFDHEESGLGSLFPMPGGMKENIEYFSKRRLHVSNAEGFEVYAKLNEYAKTPERFLPDIYDVLNCTEGCNIGVAYSHERSLFEIEKTMDDAKRIMMAEQKKLYYDNLYNSYDEKFELQFFLRDYKAVPASETQITEEDIHKAMLLLGKDDYEKQHIDCSACGSDTCYAMARKIALKVNIPVNCIFKSNEDVKTQHEANMLAQKQIAEMEKIREADERMRAMLDTCPIVAHFWDADCNLIDCNLAAVKMFNMANKQEYIDKYFQLTPEYQPCGKRSKEKLKHYLNKALSEGYQRIEWIRQTQDGQPIPFELTLDSVECGGRRLIAAYCRDLREQKRMIEELEQSREQNNLQLVKLNLMMQGTKIALWDMVITPGDPVNPTNKIIYSDEFRKMLGYENETDFPNVIRSWYRLLHPEDREKSADALLKHLIDTTGKTPFDIEFRLLKKNGKYSYFRSSGETIRDKNGNAVRVAGSMMDVTETKKLIQEIQRQRMEAELANRAKTTFLANMSHEIRTPMNSIIGFTELAQQNDNPPKTSDYLNHISDSAKWLLAIINDILDISKIESGKIELDRESFDLHDVLAYCRTVIYPKTEEKGLQMYTYAEPLNGKRPIGDPVRLRQILMNLLSNAVKFTNQGIIKLLVSVINSDDKSITLGFEVKDSGIGMNSAQIARIFEPFVQGDDSITRMFGGAGLGLAITKNIIELMGGTLQVESTLGVGSSFRFKLKFDMTEEPQKDLTDANASALTDRPVFSGNVLVCEDNTFNQKVISDHLAKVGLEIVIANNGREGVELVTKKIEKGEKPFDLIFMDIHMPVMDGLEASSIINGLKTGTPVVALTANIMTNDIELYKANGMKDYLGKPFTSQELWGCLQKYLT
ncbi:MAG: ATP-binding protein [Defluviitaleaceae bacterium]|nr:ATP-binding protein [Defluviitaleaceae bacterium]